jgi:SAM-dependent methyltransferase
MVDRTPCDLCGEVDFEPLAERDRQGHELATVVCRKCGLVSHATIPSNEELATYYADSYRQDYHGEYTPKAFRVLREWVRGEQFVRQLAYDLKPPARVLEVGSGIGCTVMNFTLAGYEARGIEPGAGFSNYSRTRLHADVIPTTLEDAPPLPPQDLVLLVHVLEHLPSPTETLTQIRNLLAPRGYLYLEVPNFAANHAAPGKQFHFAHVYNFTPATIRMLAAKAGFKIHRAYTSPHHAIIGYLLAKTEPAPLKIEGTSYVQTMEAARRFSRWSYYVRTEYLLAGIMSRARRVHGRMGAKRKVAAILARCDAYASERKKAIPVRRAA